MDNEKARKIITSGKRKSAVARAIITEGNGNVKINRRDYKTLSLFDKLRIEEPIRITKEVLGKTDFDVSVEVHSGGEKGQIEAARLALARAISEFEKSKELTNAFESYDRNLLVADVRRKETRKPGDSKARAKRQASKR
jgi:small subunit ribosomal protein S9